MSHDLANPSMEMTMPNEQQQPDPYLGINNQLLRFILYAWCTTVEAIRHMFTAAAESEWMARWMSRGLTALLMGGGSLWLVKEFF
jgi:hypothetical protein